MVLVINTRSGAGSGIIIVILIIVAIVALYLWKSRSTAASAAPTAPPVETPPTTPLPTTTPTTPTTSTDLPYALIGSPTEMEDEGQGTRHYASGKPDDVTHEWEAQTSATSYAIIIDITLTEIDHDDTISFKFGGTHMGSGWYDGGYSFESGQACMGKEEDHPSTDLCEVTGNSIGNLVNTPVKLMAVNINKGEKLEMWSNLGNGWTKDVETGPGVTGFRPNVDEDECTIRIDAAPGIEMRSAIVQEISPTGGGGTTTTTTPPSGSGTDDDDEEDGEAGAAQVADEERCDEEFNGSCNTECSSGSNSSECSECRAVCGESANIARVFSAKRRFLRGLGARATEKEDSDVDWDWEKPEFKKQLRLYSPGKRRGLRLSNIN